MHSCKSLACVFSLQRVFFFFFPLVRFASHSGCCQSSKVGKKHWMVQEWRSIQSGCVTLTGNFLLYNIWGYIISVMKLADGAEQWCRFDFSFLIVSQQIYIFFHLNAWLTCSRRSALFYVTVKNKKSKKDRLRKARSFRRCAHFLLFFALCFWAVSENQMSRLLRFFTWS